MTEYQEKGHGPNLAIPDPAPSSQRTANIGPIRHVRDHRQGKILGDPQQLLRRTNGMVRDVRPRQRRRRLPPSRE